MFRAGHRCCEKTAEVLVVTSGRPAATTPTAATISLPAVYPLLPVILTWISIVSHRSILIKARKKWNVSSFENGKISFVI